MRRSYYSSSISQFCSENPKTILGELAETNEFQLEQTQKDAWLQQIHILQPILKNFEGGIYFEYVIPRMGKRIDVLLVLKSLLVAIEFKVGETSFAQHSIDQAWDYALDLKNFHETSHDALIAPILVATEATAPSKLDITTSKDRVINPLLTNSLGLKDALDSLISISTGSPINLESWEKGRYLPTPTIIEAATALYAGHSVEEISRSDAGKTNLSITSKSISQIISDSKKHSRKSICFVTGVPGAGKTLVGLDVATRHKEDKSGLHGILLSGNAPLVAVLGEALTRDSVKSLQDQGKKITKAAARRAVNSFIQIVHHFRDEYVRDTKSAPPEHVALFDEAQRAWDLAKTADFMRRKKGVPDFKYSEPEFLISCLDRHKDWAVVVCLVGGGQEIHTGESGISEWISALKRSFPDWHINISPRLTDSEFGAGEVLKEIKSRPNVNYDANLHLGVSLRSFRAENVSLLVKQILDIELDGAKETFKELSDRYPIAITRNLDSAKKWLQGKARGSERYGMVASSNAQRLRPHAIHVKAPMKPVNWFLEGKGDVRSSFHLEDVATEFSIQGLEIDWACVTWDGDFRFNPEGWSHHNFVGTKWNRVNKLENQEYLKNAYRVLLTRARQGMVIFVPEGDPEDKTRFSGFYDPTYNYLKNVGLVEI